MPKPPFYPYDAPLPGARTSHRFLFLLTELNRAWRMRLDQRLKPLGLSLATGGVLWSLAARSTLTQIQLARHIGIEGSSLVRQVDKLEAEGLVRRVRNPEDRRANLLELTEAGEPLARRVIAEGVAVRDELFEGIPDADLETTLRTLHLLRTRLPD
ncbi:MarR family winged helix-turn-helix transcriptional regulator [Nitratidesulfovibrio termitidis]|uniref:MarR family winged helix-turn-helix transcriptional regulator n=1 Tax=Nitratidesulfovibrio termitidis TaxID=42252 RepID=UPI000409C2ED|nr:MarR family transcriptional regulator [Nitratidesulfovibrio termitidis]